MHQRIQTYFKNRLQERRRLLKEAQDKLDVGEGVRGMDVKGEQSGTPGKTDLAPLLKNLKARAPSASNLWAAQRKELVEQRRQELGGSIGARQQAKAELFRALSADEQAHWAAQAQEEKEKRQGDPDAYLEYVGHRCFP